MRKTLIVLCALFACATARAITVNWIVDGETYTQTTCSPGDDITPPTPPAKYGYTFREWAPYTPIEYIESTGTQYIDTGIIPQNYNYSVEFRMSAFGWGKLFFGMGTTMSPVWGGDGYQFGIAGSGGYSSWGGGTANTVASVLGVAVNVFYDYKINKTGVYVNGVLRSVISDQIDYMANASMYIGRSNNPSGSYNDGRSKWSYVKIYDDNNILIFNGSPVLDSDGTPCMYDKVSGTFFYNAGTGEFIAGPAIQ